MEGRLHAGVFPVVSYWFRATAYSCGHHSYRMSVWSATLALVARSSVGNYHYPTVGLAAVAYGSRDGAFMCWGVSCWPVFGECYVIYLLCQGAGLGWWRYAISSAVSSESDGGLSQRLVTLTILLCLLVACWSDRVMRCVLPSPGVFDPRIGRVGLPLLSEVRLVGLGGPYFSGRMF